MPDKFIGWYGAIAAFFTALLAMIANKRFVSKYELYGKDGRPLYMHASECEKAQRKCHNQVCTKINEFKKETKEHFDRTDKKLDAVHDGFIKIETLIRGINGKG